MFIGWDWASESHDVTVIDDAGGVIEHLAFEHTEAAISTVLGRLSELSEAPMPVAIERPSGLVVERLLDAGHPVVPIHPNAFAATRPRWGASRAKSDPGDSYKLADLLRTDGHRFRVLRPLSDEARNLLALCRQRDDVLAARIAATNQLRALLETHWPGAAGIFARLDSDIAMAFLRDYPTPDSASRLGEARMEKFCRRHRYSGRRSPAELLERLRRAPVAPTRLDPEVLAALVATQVALLQHLTRALGDLDRRLTAAAAEHPKHTVLAPLPRVGSINLAQILAEVGPILDRAIDCDHACAEVGASPVTHESGKGRGVSFRWAANGAARDALATFADNSRHASPWAADVYARARARGKRHPHAVRILMRAWMRVIWACWHTNTTYDPALHGAEQRLNAA